MRLEPDNYGKEIRWRIKLDVRKLRRINTRSRSTDILLSSASVAPGEAKSALVDFAFKPRSKVKGFRLDGQFMVKSFTIHWPHPRQASHGLVFPSNQPTRKRVMMTVATTAYSSSGQSQPTWWPTSRSWRTCPKVEARPGLQEETVVQHSTVSRFIISRVKMQQLCLNIGDVLDVDPATLVQGRLRKKKTRNINSK